MTPVRIRLLWHPQAQFAGYHLAEHLGLGRSGGVAITCQPVDFADPAMDALLAGRIEMAVAAPSHLLESADPSALAFVLAIQQASPLVYPVRKAAGIATLAGLAGRRVGVWPGHEDLELRWMLARAGVPEASVERLPMGDTVGPFVRGEIDAAQMTVYHELHEAEAELGAGALHLFRAAEHDAGLIKDGLVVRKDWLAGNQAVAAAAVAAVLEGWSEAFRAPERALALCGHLRPDMAAGHHRTQLADIRALALTGATLGHGLGYPAPEHVGRTLAALREVGLPVPDLAPEEVADRTLWSAAPEHWRSRSWP